MRQFWPHTLLGMSLTVAVWLTHPGNLSYAMIMLAGLLLSIPIAVVTSWPSFGRLLMRWQLVSLPEEISPPLALKALDLAVARYRATFKADRHHDKS
ncbi:MAG: hypothetical protein ACOYMH_17035, partial [Zwartia sp.]